MSDAAIAMPKYRCHKEVWALKIRSIERKLPTVAELEAILNGPESTGDAVGGVIMPEDEGYGPFDVSQSYMTRHDPHVGGYYVVYGDGYKSFSPAGAFEEGYTRI